MSFLDMKAELAQAIPGMSRIYAGTLINRAWRLIRDVNLWSFQLQVGSFSTPAIISTGQVTPPTVPIPSLIYGDVAASLAWYNQNLLFPPITQFQFRIAPYPLYNIIATDFTNFDPGNFSLGTPASGYAILTLDRPFTDPIPGTGYGGGPFGGGGFGGPQPQSYELVQAYYPAPSATFKRWLSVQDSLDGYALSIWSARRDINWADPQRLITTNPVLIMGMGVDSRGAGTINASSTLGYQMYELWPTPTSRLTYQTFYVDGGPDLVANADELPYPITEDVVLSKARTYAYEWAEARKDVMAAKGSGADYLKLKLTTDAEFKERLKTLRLLDRDAVDAYQTRMQNALAGCPINPWFNTVTNRAGMGWPIGLY